MPSKGPAYTSSSMTHNTSSTSPRPHPAAHGARSSSMTSHSNPVRPINSIRLAHRNSVSVDAITVSTSDDVLAAQAHLQVAELTPKKRNQLITYLRSIDATGIEEKTPATVTTAEMIITTEVATITTAATSKTATASPLRSTVRVSPSTGQTTPVATGSPTTESSETPSPNRSRRLVGDRQHLHRDQRAGRRPQLHRRRI